MIFLEIGAQYDDAEKELGQRIRELRAQHRATDDPDTAWRLQRRIEELIPLRKEARQLSNLCLHYYERSFWRSELYTFNDAIQRVPGRPGSVAAGKRRNKQRADEQTEAKPAQSNRRGPDTPAERSGVDALLQQLVGNQNRRKAGRTPVHRKQNTDEG